VATIPPGLLVLVGDGGVEPVAQPGLRPLPATRQFTQKFGIQNPRIERQAASRVVAPARTLVGDEAGEALPRCAGVGALSGDGEKMFRMLRT
jgi:hypothetical protein